MTSFAGRIAVVTGAGSGIGQALAVELAKSGATVAITDKDPAGLADTAASLEALGTIPRVDILDVSDRESFSDYAHDVAAHFGRVNQLYNIAGVGFTGDLEVMPFEAIERVMDVNFWGVVNGTKSFLPHLIASGDGHLINMSSTAGLCAIAGQGAYSAAKFAVRGFTEALRQEMLLAGHAVAVTAVHPGGVRTAIARNSGAVEGVDTAEFARIFDGKLARTSAERAAQIILDGTRRRKARVLVGNDARFLDALVRLTGSGYQRLFVKLVAGALSKIH
ncbi:SDR family NAD(P)-dependent oxidoreductase [Mycolicibacterium austroafricanum]|uniref:SDR family NAD(P)-dependent oxidoreductase n=1 Tax=Mycolicibacterium austroafricanum TaxID=39687 RepID=UPI00056D6136|nr:SDR family oxidoreductase [Mycolicibacterium austroafricanum]QZY47016.1 SDR family oxidoreductase [Mycolicibacterium austroafricanum]